MSPFESAQGDATQGPRDILSGAERDRTADLYVANVPLSQLSYCPTDYQFNNGGATEVLPTSKKRFSI